MGTTAHLRTSQHRTKSTNWGRAHVGQRGPDSSVGSVCGSELPPGSTNSLTQRQAALSPGPQHQGRSISKSPHLRGGLLAHRQLPSSCVVLWASNVATVCTRARSDMAPRGCGSLYSVRAPRGRPSCTAHLRDCCGSESFYRCVLYAVGLALPRSSWREEATPGMKRIGMVWKTWLQCHVKVQTILKSMAQP